MAIEVVGAGDGAHVILTGDFDLPAALRVCATCDRVAKDETPLSIVLDFTHVRQLSDVALAALADYLTHVPSRVKVRGLTQHQNRMLRYLGTAGGGDSAP